MRQIILASNSRARAEILRKSGIRFKVRASYVQEKKYTKNASLSHLVIQNAALKAQAVKKFFKQGVVIAADTLAVQGKQVFGKPKDKEDVFFIIRQLSRRPSYIYTGIAVLDIEKNRVFTDYEKTKVWMSKMTNKQIKRYLSGKNISHMNFAGGFDIQGKGSLFIERIDGCFYNVVGLPLAKLYKSLRKCGIEI